MTHQEKRAWIMLVVSAGGYAAYVFSLLSRADGRALADVSYAAALLWTIGGAIIVSILAEIVVAVADPGGSRESDVRDREIGRFGEYVGQSFVVIGAVAAMLMAIAEWDQFWIANVIYLCFVLSAVLGSVAKIGFYRGGLPQW